MAKETITVKFDSEQLDMFITAVGEYKQAVDKYNGVCLTMPIMDEIGGLLVYHSEEFANGRDFDQDKKAALLETMTALASAIDSGEIHEPATIYIEMKRINGNELIWRAQIES